MKRTTTLLLTLACGALTALLSLAALTTRAANAYGLPDKIEDGVILHCFDWKFADIEAELPNIAAAGFTAVQTSPAQANRNYSTIWYDVYRPWDFVIGNTILGSKADLQSLCTKAHELGIKVIVDVVANHTTGFSDEINNCPAYWQDLSHYHTEGGITNYNNRYQVTHHNIGMHDIRTEDADNQQRIAAYVQELKSVGVDGIRWDAAKHIGVPSEGDNFWPAVIDSDMFNYGEILGSPGGDAASILAEYWQYMSITDSNYGTNTILGSLKGGSVPSASGNYSNTYSTRKLIYWAESHDTFCNSGDASVGVAQNTVDRAYAIAASRNGIPALYFARPKGGASAGPSARLGDKGETHFADKEVAEVNKFHNRLAGQDEAYATLNGAASICRQGGAVVVKGSGTGSVTVTNAGGKTPAGTYTDVISGNRFTVTPSVIIGTVGETGIAVFYTNAPLVKLSPEGGEFTTETLDVTATLENATSGWVKVGDGPQQSLTGTKTVTIGEGVDYGQTITLQWSATNESGTQTGMAVYTKADTRLPDCAAWVADSHFCYFEAPASWGTVNVWAWINGQDGKDYVGTGWPGPALTEVVGNASNGNLVYLWKVPAGKADPNGGIIFSHNGGNSDSDKAGGGNLVFQNGAYYKTDGSILGIVTTIKTLQPAPSYQQTAALYDLQGRRLPDTTLDSQRPAPGIYIQAGKKFAIR